MARNCKGPCLPYCSDTKTKVFLGIIVGILIGFEAKKFGMPIAIKSIIKWIKNEINNPTLSELILFKKLKI